MDAGEGEVDDGRTGAGGGHVRPQTRDSPLRATSDIAGAVFLGMSTETGFQRYGFNLDQTIVLVLH